MSKDNTNGGGDKSAGDTPEEEFTMVEVDGEGKPIGQLVEEAPDEDDADPADLGEDQDDDDVERVGHVEGDQDEHRDGETVEEKRERRRRENRAKRVRNRVASESKDRLIENQGRMLLNLQEQVAQLQGRSVQYDLNLLQSNLSQIESQQSDAKAVLAKLVKAGDAEGQAEVIELQMSLRDQHRQITEQLRRAKSNGRGRAQGGEVSDGEGTRERPRPAAPDPEIVRKAQGFVKGLGTWADPQQGDPEEIQIIRAIDHNLHKEGWDPRSDDYWAELKARTKRRLPHRFNKAAPNGSGSNGGNRVSADDSGKKAAPNGSGGPRMAPVSQSGGGRPLGRNEVRVTPDRKAAMQAAGKWDDPVKRNKQLAAYAKYDKEHAGQ
jgi:hypothetical protein